MASTLRAVGLLAAGAGVMFLLDPDRGERRRADLRDEARHIGVRVRARFIDGLGTWQDRMARVRTRLHHKLRPERGAFDDLIREQVRTAIEGITHTPPAVEVHVRDGHVTLAGRVHATEVQPILDAVESVPGVVALTDALHLREPLNHRPRATRIARTLSRQARWWPLVAILAGAVGALRNPEA